MRKEIRDFWKDESGMGTVEVKCEGVQTNLTKRRKEPEPQYLRGKMRFV